MSADFLSFLKPELAERIREQSEIRTFPKGTEILKARQYVNVLPIVIKGLIKVFTSYEEKELLLYYIEPQQSCIMTFYAAMNNSPSKVFATTEEDSELLLIPVQYLPKWLKEYPDLNSLFYDHYNLRYTELLETIGQLLVHKMDQRLFEYLKKKSDLLNEETIKMSHNHIANELGTAREVISRMLKKLENDGLINQNKEGIKIL